MTPSNWKNNRCGENLNDRQRQGLLVILAVVAFVYAAMSAYEWDQRKPLSITASSAQNGPVVVEITGDIQAAGIYHLEENTTLSELLTRIASIDLSVAASAPELGRVLRNGDAVRIDSNRHLHLGRMEGTTRLALGIPVNINTATREELIMIPGIGEKTAQGILELRRSSPGGIRKMEELVAIKGIKGKRLEKLRRYLYIEGTV